MSDYMSFERMQAIAEEVRAYFSVNKYQDFRYKQQMRGNVYYSGQERGVISNDGRIYRKKLSDVSSGWVKNYDYNDDYTYYEDISYESELWKGYEIGSVSITESEISRGLKILQEKERKKREEEERKKRKPIFVGTKQVSAIYVKSNGTIKTVKPYIKQSGQIKAL